MSKIQKPNIYMEDLYNFCCLKTSIFKNNQKKANNKIKNNILREISHYSIMNINKNLITILHQISKIIKRIDDFLDTHLKDEIMPKYAETIYNGFWFSSERIALQNLIDSTQKNVTGDVRLKLYKGNIIISGRKSPLSKYKKLLCPSGASQLNSLPSFKTI